MDAAYLSTRQTVVNSNDLPPGWVIQNGRAIPWWYSRTGVIVKWSVFLGMTTLFAAFLIIGYAHGKRRLRKGLLPLGYHRWLFSRAQLARVDSRYAWPAATYNTYRPEYYNTHPQAQGGGYYGMQGMPPPTYDPNSARPPMYAPPDGGSKVEPSQEYGVTPPQASVAANHTGQPYPYRAQ
ncbi:hypothetical protein BDP81DRAFT_489000 [Colletotrichum phormii]|uniref:Ubiquitin-protein ligase sel1 n=1 Tax=Colletotrichum phormii TaxID=359342 RepID=A0AAI9ZSP7_9PEZI|nr:uncharacterized protein BDP81DRAFT_489000 [Colletotrichum phormii]KAK1635957.1 hypothetical protein BDP81DRAFT_489000 [Colletotrichum phormii]